METALPIPEKATDLKKDSRGRVRFTYNGYRFEITEHSIKAYERTQAFGENLVYMLPSSLLTDELVAKLNEAVELAHAE